MKNQPQLSFGEEILRKISTKYRVPLWCKFTKALKIYDLLAPNDKICICISGGKDSMLMALLFKLLRRHSDFPFDIEYLVMNPGYNEVNDALIKENLRKLEIPARIVKTDIFEIANKTDLTPCYLCAKMRRGALYRIAKELGCNKIALGHHYDDVIDTTLMNMLNSGSFQTMLPKLPSTNYEGMELIRPLYLIREEDILAFKENEGLRFIACACRFTEGRDSGHVNSQRQKTKELIATLKKTYNPLVEKNIFKAAENVEIEKILGYKNASMRKSFLDGYSKRKEALFDLIRDSETEKKALEKAIAEHRPFVYDNSLYKRFKED